MLVETKFILTNRLGCDNSCSYRLCWHDSVSDHGCDFFGIGRELGQVDIFAGASPSGHFRGCKSKWTFLRVQVKVDIFAGASPYIDFIQPISIRAKILSTNGDTAPCYFDQSFSSCPIEQFVFMGMAQIQKRRVTIVSTLTPYPYYDSSLNRRQWR